MVYDEALQKRMDYMQDVEGWKSIIFLPFQFIWQCIMIFSIIFVFTMTITRVTYEIDAPIEVSLNYLFDLIYFVDFICSILHHFLQNTRKLKNYKSRSWAAIVIDGISLIPLEVLYIAFYLSNKTLPKSTFYYLFLNRTLRIYRIHYYFNDYEIMMNSLKWGIFYNSLQNYIYWGCITLVFSCIYHTLRDSEEIEEFEDKKFDTIVLTYVNTYFLIAQSFIGDKLTHDSTKKRLFFVCVMVVGYLYIYGIVLPKIMFAFMKRHRTYFDFWNRFKRLKTFIKNVIANEELEKKTLQLIRTVWTYGKGDYQPELLRTYPINMQKNAYADIYWDAMRHSELLQNLSRSCKRSLALKIIGDFFEPGTIFWDLEENKNTMMYLASGIVQIMAVENKEAPIMSLSGGTVLGETSLFFPEQSKAILRVATFSEIHMLHAKDFFRTIKDYPDDRDLVLKNLRSRIQIARMTQVRRKEISEIIFSKRAVELGYIGMDEFESIKWIKAQLRKIAALEELQNKHGAVVLKTSDLKTTIEHTSLYLPLLNLGEDIEVITDQTCLKTTMPWVIDPNSPFIRHWQHFILFIVIICTVLYPLMLSWSYSLPEWYKSLTVLISLFYIFDVFIQISTAVKTKDLLIAKSGPIFRYRLRQLSFYADIISAPPYEVLLDYIHVDPDKEDIVLRACIAVALVKFYRMITFFEMWCQTLRGRFSVRIFLKHLIYMLVLTYWTAAFIHLCDVRCFIWPCSNATWYNMDLERQYPNYHDLASFFFCMTYFFGIASPFGYEKLFFPGALVYYVSLILFQAIWTAWCSEFACAYLSESSQKVQYKRLMQSIGSFMNEKKIVGRVQKRVWDTMRFQWVYDCGDYLTQQSSMLDDAPAKLKTEVNKITIFKTLKTCEAFHSESDAFIWYLCKKGSRLALPAGSIVVTFGTQTMCVYAVYKGYLQVNSFLPRDITESVAVPAIYGPGKIVPIVIAFNQMPSGVTARALTDCELISIPLETLLVGLVISGSLKDFVDAIKELDVEPCRNSRLVFTRVAKSTVKEDPNFRAPFKAHKQCGWLYRCFLKRKTINPLGKNYFKWELFRLLTFIIESIGWPFAFNFPPCTGITRFVLICILLGFDFLTLFDFYIKLHLGYYTSSGIYIYHPLSTASHYLSTAFVIEVFTFLPFIHCIIEIARSNYLLVLPEWLTIIHCLIRYIALYRVYLFAKHYSEIQTSSFLRTIAFLSIFFIGMNCYILLKIRTEVVWTCTPDGKSVISFLPHSWIQAMKLEKVDTLIKTYLIMSHFVVMMVYRSGTYFKAYTYELLIFQIIATVLGLVLWLINLAFILSSQTGSKMNFIIYQDHMKSLTNFLKMEKVDDNISKEAINHFEHEWERKNGEDLHTVFRRFPNILYEDMMCPIYLKLFMLVPCFQNANDGFFRSLSRTFVEVHFRKGSVISFENAVHRDIYFILSGLCFVKDRRKILGEGSILGDIRGKGKMTNNILAQTHVVLLAITSRRYFTILNNFAETEAAFFRAVAHVEDFMESTSKVPEKLMGEDSSDWLTAKPKATVCEFEVVTDKPAEFRTEEKKRKVKKRIKRAEYITPDSRLDKYLLSIFMSDALITAFFIPMIMCVRLENFPVAIAVHILDAIWFIKIVVSFRTAYVDPETGNLVTNKKKISRHYLKSFDGFFIDFLSVLPVEQVFYLLDIFFPISWQYRRYCYMGRLLRIFTLWIRVKKAKRKLSLRDRTKWAIIIIKQLLLYNILTMLNSFVKPKASDVEIYDHMTGELLPQGKLQPTHEFGTFEEFIWRFLTVFNVYAGTGLHTHHPESLLEVSFLVLLSMYVMYERALLVSDALSIIHASLYVKSEKLYKMQIMDNFLSVRNVSPFLRKNLLRYACDILLHYKGEVEPFFLITAPYNIKVGIMQDLYLQHLYRCNVFREMPLDFLKQLAARFQRQVFFPKDVITEKGDVDFSMYFVHNGEVASIETDQVYYGLDYETGQFGSGDFFGLEQGLIYGKPQATTYRALTKVDLLILNYFEWEDLRVAFPDVVIKIMEKLKD